jgi:hypothetical protein
MKAKLVKETLNESMNLSAEDYNHIYKKLEYSFKKSGNSLVSKILNEEELNSNDLNLLLKKFEYSFRKSNPEIISRIKDYLGIEDVGI